jgi:tetratricopeptide (TPR) repeat protein
MKKLLSILIISSIYLSLMITNVNAIPIRNEKSSNEVRQDILDQYPTGKEPSSANDFYGQGMLYLSRNMNQEAGEQFRKALKLDPNHVYSMIGIVAISLRLGDEESAKEFSSKAIKLKPDDVELRNLIGERWMRDAGSSKYLPEAESRFKEALLINPKFVPAHVNLARLYILMKKIDDGIKEYQQAISIQPQNPELRRELSYIYLNIGKVDEGLAEAKKMVELAPQNPVYHNGLGEIYLDKKQLDEALNEFQQAVNLNPKYSPAYVNIGKVYIAQGQFDKAIGEINKAIANDPDYGDAYAVLGDIYLVKGMNQNAIELYKKAIAEKATKKLSIPNFVSVLNNLAYLYSDDNMDLDTAMSYAKKANQLAPKHPDIADTLGWIHYQKGNYDEAINNLKVAVEGSPNNPIIKYHLGASYYKKGLKDQAAEELKKSLGISDKFKGADDAKLILAEIGK